MVNSLAIEAEGGVSPVKRRTSKSYAGSKGIRATRGKGRAGRRRRRGFSKAGAKGVNVHGYSALTRFKPRKVYKGPLSSATTPKSGGNGGGGGKGGGGGGGNTTNSVYNIDNSTTTTSGDTISNIDNRQWNDNRSQTINAQSGNVTSEGDNLNAKLNNEPTITNETDNTATNDQKQETEQKNVSPFYEACHNPDGSRVQSGTIGTSKSTGKKFKCEWDPNWKPRNKSKNKQESNIKQKIETNIDASNTQTSNQSTNRQQQSGHVTVNAGGFMTSKSSANPLEYDPSKRSPVKMMNSHAWDMQQNMAQMRTGMGGTGAPGAKPLGASTMTKSRITPEPKSTMRSQSMYKDLLTQ